MGDNLPEQGFYKEKKTLELVRTVSKSEVGCESVLSECVPGAFEELWVLEEAIPMLGGH